MDVYVCDYKGIQTFRLPDSALLFYFKLLNFFLKPSGIFSLKNYPALSSEKNNHMVLK